MLRDWGLDSHIQCRFWHHCCPCRWIWSWARAGAGASIIVLILVVLTLIILILIFMIFALILLIIFEKQSCTRLNNDRCPTEDSHGLSAGMGRTLPPF